MKKLFSWQIIKQSVGKTWVWGLVAVAGQSLNFLLFPSAVETDADKAMLIQKYAEAGLLLNGMIFMTIIAIVCSYVLITSEVEKGTLSITLNTPTTRLQILLSKMVVFALLITGICTLIGLIGTLSPTAYGFGADFNFAKWWTIIALWLAYCLFMGGAACAIMCWFNKGTYALSITAIILGAFFMISMIAQMDNFDFMKYFTPQTLLDMDAVLKGKSVIWQLLVMPLAAIPFYAVGVIKFLKKDLPI